MSEQAFLWSSDREGKLYAPPADAPVAQLTAYAALTGLSLACHVAGAALGVEFSRLLSAYEREWAATTDAPRTTESAVPPDGLREQIEARIAELAAYQEVTKIGSLAHARYDARIEELRLLLSLIDQASQSRSPSQQVREFLEKVDQLAPPTEPLTYSHIKAFVEAIEGQPRAATTETPRTTESAVPPDLREQIEARIADLLSRRREDMSAHRLEQIRGESIGLQWVLSLIDQGLERPT